jgi:hypothetical protein
MFLDYRASFSQMVNMQSYDNDNDDGDDDTTNECLDEKDREEIKGGIECPKCGVEVTERPFTVRKSHSPFLPIYADQGAICCKVS